MSRNETGTVARPLADGTGGAAGAGMTPNGTRVKQAWGQHLGRYPWDHFLTLTFRRESIADFARRSWLAYVRRLEKLAAMPLVWFYGTEYGALGRLHIHALTLNTGQLSITQLHREWYQPAPSSRGMTRIAVYSPLLGAAHYVAKYVTKDLADYDVSDRLREATAARGRQFRDSAGAGLRIRRAEAARGEATAAEAAAALAEARLLGSFAPMRKARRGRSHRPRRPQHSHQRQH